MPHIIRLLTTVAILLHATAGCCAHEGHCAVDAVCEHTECPDSGEHDHSHDVEIKTAPLGVGAGSPCNHDSGQHQPHECSHDNCKWPSPETRCNAELILSSVASFSYVLDAPIALLLSAGGIYSAFLSSDSHHALPVRTHLAKSVFLI